MTGTLNWLDIVLLAVLAFSVFRSFRRGFTREITGLAAALCALVLGMWFYGLAGSYVRPYVGSVRMANLLGFAIVVLLILVAGSLVGMIVSRFLRTIGLSFFDRLLGAGFGLIRGLLIAITLLTAYTAFGPPAETADGKPAEPKAVLNSRIAPWILEASHYFVAIAPMDLKQSFGRQYSEIKALLEKATLNETLRDSGAHAEQGTAGN
jgi:membrane protein required for colicin V production